MGDNNFDNINLELYDYDMIVCDKSFDVNDHNIYKLSYKEIKDTLLANKDKNILYVVTGSVLYYSSATIIAKHLKEHDIEYKLIDNISSKSYLLSRLAISESDVESISLHGRSNIDLDILFKKRYTLILCDDKSIDRLKEALLYLDSHDYSITLGYKLGYIDEQIKSISIDDSFDKSSPHVLLIKKKFAYIGSDDSDFVTQNEMITKKIKRELSIEALELRANMKLLDIGAGSGSIAIVAHKKYRVSTILFEKNPLRYDNIIKNLKSHKVVDTKPILCDVSEHIAEYCGYDRVFIGGGGSAIIDKLDIVYNNLAKDGIIVANFVTLIHLNHAISKLKELDIEFEVNSISIDGYKSDLLISESQRLMFMIKVRK
jgi:precorrin-6Y C5,15-methyltransferase (decarboxylating)